MEAVCTYGHYVLIQKTYPFTCACHEGVWGCGVEFHFLSALDGDEWLDSLSGRFVFADGVL